MTQVHHIIVAFGSNNNWRENKPLAIRLARSLVATPVFTSTVRSKDVCGGKKVYSNILMEAFTELPLKVLSDHLKHIESICGDTAELRAQGVVNLDLDLLLFDDRRLHKTDWERPYIKTLFQELNERKEHRI